MKKIGILTFHRAHSYGAVLQSYALQKAVSSDADCKIINYYCQYLENIYSLIPTNNKNIFFLLKKIIKIPAVLRMKLKFNSFTKYLNLTKPIYAEDLKGLNKQFDIFIVGSDQVWNSNLSAKDMTYFLNFVDDNQKKKSYSASFGISMLTEKQKNLYKPLLSGFNQISVREKQGQTIIKDLLGIDVPVVLDPTLLINKYDWGQIAILPKDDNYILLYTISISDKILKFTQELSKATGCKIIFITSTLRRQIKAKYVVCTPNEWLGYFLKAKYIVTNSFHGLCFSINFNKEFFIDFLPNNTESVNSRLENMLDTFRLRYRLIDNIEKDYNKSIDYGHINTILKTEREKSISYLKSITQ